MSVSDNSARPTDRNGFRFRGGSIAVDLAATLQGRLGANPRELLATPADLDRWLVSSGLAVSPPGSTELDLTNARRLREAIYGLARRGGQRPLDREDVRVLNAIAAASPPAPELRIDGRIELRSSACDLLCQLARDAIHLFGGPDAARLRQCRSPNCTIFFVDTSPTADRRWCAMAACGNKAKVAEFRRRKREAGVDP